jgi:hypothetical protein
MQLLALSCWLLALKLLAIGVVHPAFNRWRQTGQPRSGGRMKPGAGNYPLSLHPFPRTKICQGCVRSKLSDMSPAVQATNDTALKGRKKGSATGRLVRTEKSLQSICSRRTLISRFPTPVPAEPTLPARNFSPPAWRHTNRRRPPLPTPRACCHGPDRLPPRR